MAASVVIKVKYGDTLRRLNGEISGNGELNLTMDDLKNKISSLFSFQPDTELVLTYIDEDDDVVTLANDDDLRDVVRQALNPLRITVKVNAGKSGLKFPVDDNGASEVLKSLAGPLNETLMKLGDDMASKAEHMQKSLQSLDKLMRNPLQGNSEKLSADLASETKFLAEIADLFAKMGMPGVNSSSTEKGVSGNNEGSPKTKPATL